MKDTTKLKESIVKLRKEGMKLKEIGERLDCSRQYAGKVCKESIKQNKGKDIRITITIEKDTYERIKKISKRKKCSITFLVNKILKTL